MENLTYSDVFIVALVSVFALIGLALWAAGLLKAFGVGGRL